MLCLNKICTKLNKESAGTRVRHNDVEELSDANYQNILILITSLWQLIISFCFLLRQTIVIFIKIFNVNP